MNIVTHEHADTLKQFKDIPSFRFLNQRMTKKMKTENRKTMVGQLINRIYVDSLEIPREFDNSHQLLFVVDVPYYRIFCKMYQDRFGAIPTSFDTLTPDNIVAWCMDTYSIKVRKAKALLDYFNYNLLKMLYNPDAVNTFITGKSVDPNFTSYTYDTVLKYLLSDSSVTADDYLRALSKYHNSHTAITKWLKKTLSKQPRTIEIVKLQLWLQGKTDSDLLIFAKEVL